MIIVQSYEIYSKLGPISGETLKSIYSEGMYIRPGGGYAFKTIKSKYIRRVRLYSGSKSNFMYSISSEISSNILIMST